MPSRSEIAGFARRSSIEVVGCAECGDTRSMTRSARASAGQLVGREGEQRLVREALERSAQGAPCALVVSGEAGVGKTRFVRQVVDEAANGWGAEVLWGTCVQF